MSVRWRFGLIGEHIAYSLSPRIFEAIFAITGQPGTFDLYSVAQEAVPATLHKLASEGVHGVSVTIPHKQRVIPLLHAIEPVARAIDAVNAVRFDATGPVGTNTDSIGFSLALRPFADRLKYGSAVVIGCGGAARAIVYSLHADFEISEIIVVSRDHARLHQFIQTMGSQFDKLQLRGEIASFPLKAIPPAMLIVNCTPLGGANYAGELPIDLTWNWSTARLYYDLNYNDGNAVQASARAAGVHVINGSRMLVGQAMESFHFWTGQIVSSEPIHQLVFGHQGWPQSETDLLNR